jgi:hypothetical protein
MKYWGYLLAKLIVAGAVLFGVWVLIAHAFPPLKPMSRGGPNPVTRDLHYGVTTMLYWLGATGMIWLAIWDQRYRCRTCLRRLRMPIQRGLWAHVLLGAPHTEYICPYGHGTLSVADLQITGHQEPDWAPHDDMWKELFSLEETKK